MLKPNEARKLLTRSYVHAFVDSGDLYSCAESAGLDYFIDNPSAGITALSHFCRSLGTLKTSRVFDDNWDISKDLWSGSGFLCEYVSPDSNNDSRVISVLTLRAMQMAMEARGATTAVLIVGGADYTELIRALSDVGIRTALVGIEQEVSKRMISHADLWAPFQEVFRDVSNETAVTMGYDWTSFINLMDSLERSRLDFVGVKYLIRDLLPTIGVSDSLEAHTMVENAVLLGIIEMYQEANTKGDKAHPVQACKLVRNHSIVTDILGAAE